MINIIERYKIENIDFKKFRKIYTQKKISFFFKNYNDIFLKDDFFILHIYSLINKNLQKEFKPNDFIYLFKKLNEIINNINIIKEKIKTYGILKNFTVKYLGLLKKIFLFIKIRNEKIKYFNTKNRVISKKQENHYYEIPNEENYLDNEIEDLWDLLKIKLLEFEKNNKNKNFKFENSY